MFKSQQEIENYLKQFLVEKNKIDSSYLVSRYFELHSERLFKSYEIIQSYYSQNQFNNKVLLDLGSSNGLFLPVMQAIVPFEDINVVDYGLFWFLCGNEVYTDSFFYKIVLKVLPSKHLILHKQKLSHKVEKSRLRHP